MPIMNGDSMEGSVPVLEQTKLLDYKTATKVLENEYPERDGIDVKTLLDSKTNGGLTYNDFLVLPGYIGMRFTSWKRAFPNAHTVVQAFQPARSRSTPPSPSASV